MDRTGMDVLLTALSDAQLQVMELRERVAELTTQIEGLLTEAGDET